MKRYKIITLGCRTNQYESQAYADQLQRMGYIEGDDADLCIVNTCTVTASADKRSVYQIRQLKKHHPRARIAVTGCLTEQRGFALPEVDYVIPNLDKEKLLETVFPDEDLPEFKIERFEAHTRAFVKIQDGCNSYCSYCIIPFVRGRSRSRSIDEVLDEIRSLVDNGYKEVVLTGINIGDFEQGLAQLIRQVDRIDGLERIRVSSIDADEVDEDLADSILSGDKTCPSMHIVLQSGSNLVLKRMRRKYTRQEFINTCERLHKANADFTFTTDVIVGFPGETDQAFEETLSIIDQVRFAKVHMFPFSPRPGTRAARFTDTIEKSVVEERRQRVLRHTERIGYQLREQYVGRTMDVLIEGDNRGHTPNFLPVEVPGKRLRPNTLIEVDLIENTPEGLRGKYAHR